MDLLKYFRRESTGPQRKIFLSDTYGAKLEPTERPDADALLCTHFRSQMFDALDLKIDTFGQERVTDHLLELIIALHDEIDRKNYFSQTEKRRFRSQGTGVLVNAAPRTEANTQNGENFVVADLRGNIRVVATPLSALAPVRDDVERLRIVPNQNNGLWSATEQFRSAIAPILFDESYAKRFPLTEEDPSAIPKPDKHWHLSYVDRFGNLITKVHDPQLQLQELQNFSTLQEGFRMKIGNCVKDGLLLSPSLSLAEPGQLVIYTNGGVDLVRKWSPADTARDKIDLSAYAQFERPDIGAPIQAIPVSTAEAGSARKSVVKAL